MSAARTPRDPLDTFATQRGHTREDNGGELIED